MSLPTRVFNPGIAAAISRRASPSALISVIVVWFAIDARACLGSENVEAHALANMQRHRMVDIDIILVSSLEMDVVKHC